MTSIEVNEKQNRFMFRCSTKLKGLKKQLVALQKKHQRQSDEICKLEHNFKQQHQINIKLCYFATVPYFVTFSAFFIAYMISNVHDLQEL